MQNAISVHSGGGEATSNHIHTHTFHNTKTRDNRLSDRAPIPPLACVSRTFCGCFVSIFFFFSVSTQRSILFFNVHEIASRLRDPTNHMLYSVSNPAWPRGGVLGLRSNGGSRTHRQSPDAGPLGLALALVFFFFLPTCPHWEASITFTFLSFSWHQAFWTFSVGLHTWDLLYTWEICMAFFFWTYGI